MTRLLRRLPLLLVLLAPLLLAPLVGSRAAALPPGPPAGVSDPVGTWPLSPAPEVLAAFDPPSSLWGAGHRGVDLAGAVGQPVRSALPGTVTWVGVLAGRGVVVVDHGPTRTTYEPVVGEVSVGDVVLAGDRLGVLELAGSHCLPAACLHWGWREGDTYLDPLRLVGGGPVRLLPLWSDTRPASRWAPSGPRGALRSSGFVAGVP